MKGKRRRIVFSIISALFFSLCLVIGAELNKNLEIDWSFLTLIKILIVGIFFYGISYYLLGKVIRKREDNIKIKRWQLFLILIIPSLFLLWACFPGIFSWDSGTMYHYYADNAYTTHFSLLISWLLGTCITIGRAIFSSDNIGLSLFLLIQIIATNIVATETIYYCSKKLKNKPFLILMVLYFVTHLLFQNMLITAHQDVLFGSFVVLLILELVKMNDDDKYFSKKSNFIKVGLFTFLMCAIRNNGFFALIPVVFLGTILMRGNRKNFLLLLLTPMIIFQCYQNIIVKNIVVESEPLVRESLNVPIMQMTRALVLENDHSYDDRRGRFFKWDCNWELYKEKYDLSDDFKECMYNEQVEKHLPGFFKLWVNIGMKYPKHYVEAPLLLSLRMWYPWIEYSDNTEEYRFNPYAHHDLSIVATKAWGDNSNTDIYRQPNLPDLDNLMIDLTSKQYWSNIIGFRLIWCGAFSTFLLAISILVTWYRKKYKYLIPLAVVFGVWLTIILAPTVMFRYMFPLVLSTPILFYVIIKSVDSTKSEEKHENSSNRGNWLYRLTHRH